MLARVAPFAAALWWGSLTAVGFMVVPLLFKFLPTPAMAGHMAARLFTAQTWVSVACGVVLLLVSRSNRPSALSGRAQAALVFIVLGMLLALLIEFAVAPRIVARENLRLWHGAGSVMYAVQWLCAAAVLWRITAEPREPS
ncbi:MAG: DUF4149 domain-containing protein [Ottowia sp.]|uniref:DUF4149 domain-containing protein n=1 Tax=Ottowia sp. TaxID=1898956 RepID=UPI001B4CB19F|nr:DUF4149 domain-containing protein [Ottowia sp.]MBP7456702.1 DUF4149 domain-containing protein [Ottowia sp.]MBP7459158.1 DUF4149 domain-containing protein [Ottowia sp.]MBP8862364.1 DUF4149 domain-containing protein [Ottowia sp.]MBP8927423.1 DUF4149 domain-containing protein [Ottowia sp.]MBP9523884.1 DUF4149 domain-containing protein [Ottowia sp.]